MLILPPPNHSACGGSHFNTSSHRLNQSNSSAIRAQKTSGESCASCLSRSNSSSDRICALLENSAGGVKTRFSLKTDSMLLVAEDIYRLLLLQLVFADACPCRDLGKNAVCVPQKGPP